MKKHKKKRVAIHKMRLRIATDKMLDILPCLFQIPRSILFGTQEENEK